jgi:indole-3-glycerol phosphate synthase
MPNESTRTQTETQAKPRQGLAAILSATRERVGQLRAGRKILEQAAASAPVPPAWLPAFAGKTVSVIAEVKRRSPSAGDIAARLDPATHARAYESGGASAISVLTDGPFFGGSLDDLVAVRAAVTLPVLRKDFIVDPVQIFESRAAGASAILLIARGLERSDLLLLAALARDVGLGTLVEIHRMDELDAALAARPDTLGINSRDLETFHVDVGMVEQLLRAVPRDVVAVAESGLSSRADVEKVAAWGADAVLVGTAIASAANPETAVRALTGCARQGRVAGART